MKNQYLF